MAAYGNARTSKVVLCATQQIAVDPYINLARKIDCRQVLLLCLAILRIHGSAVLLSVTLQYLPQRSNHCMAMLLHFNVHLKPAATAVKNNKMSIV